MRLSLSLFPSPTARGLLCNILCNNYNDASNSELGIVLDTFNHHRTSYCNRTVATNQVLHRCKHCSRPTSPTMTPSRLTHVQVIHCLELLRGLKYCNRNSIARNSESKQELFASQKTLTDGFTYL